VPQGGADNDWLFSWEGPLPAFTVTLTAEATAALRASGEAYEDGLVDSVATVAGTVEIDGVGVYEVGVTLRGSPGSSFQPIDSKPHLKLAFDEVVPGATLDGLRSLRLYNQWEDVGQVARMVGYRVWRDQCYAAPRAGFATVRLDRGDGLGPVELGPFGTNEEVDATFLASRPAWFGSAAGSLYEGEYGQDLLPARPDEWPERKLPDDQTSTDDLGALVDALASARSLEDLEPVLNTDRFLDYWALEIAVGAREGYATQVNNYYLYADPTDGDRFTFLPWGFDQTLYDELPVDQSSAALTSRGLEAFRDEYHHRLRRQLRSIDWDQVRGDIDDQAARVEGIDPYPGAPWPHDPAEIGEMQDLMRAYTRDAPEDLLAYLRSTEGQ
jgi:hypothetical protein